MSLEVVGMKKATVISGDINNYRAHSCFIRPREAKDDSNPARYMYTHFGVSIIVTDDKSVFISVDGGYIESNNLFNETGTVAEGGYSGWPDAFLCACLNSFSLGCVAGYTHRFRVNRGGSVGTYTYTQGSSNKVNFTEGDSANGVIFFYDDFGIYAPDTNSGESTHGIAVRGYTNSRGNLDSSYVSSHNRLASAQSVSIGQTFSSRSDLEKIGYYYIGNLNNATWINNNAYLWVGGMCLFNGENGANVANDAWIDAYRIEIPEIKELLINDYYPWSRYANSAWQSLNREGPDQDNAGLHRYSGTWNRETNREKVSNDSTYNHGHRYNSGWVASPEDK